jgi:hypothetical protein
VLHLALLAAGLGQPVQRQRDGDHREQHGRAGQGAVELVALELLVAQIGLAVGRQLDL